MSAGLLSVVFGDAACSVALLAGATALVVAGLALGGGRAGNCTQSPATVDGAAGFGVLVSAGADFADEVCAGAESGATGADVAAVAVTDEVGRFFLAGRAGKWIQSEPGAPSAEDCA